MAAYRDQPNLVEKAVLKLSEPENQAWLLKVAWRISLLMLVLGFLIIIKTLLQNLS
ncbi:MAG: hypothetical protein PHV51_03495 [Methanosarcinaceae archaeon]|nr:hypothetical protein [Methanosarcinaceae archaeon]MDD4497207.1 hypothetical protein [Methanosarcinaceae archaeon]